MWLCWGQGWGRKQLSKSKLLEEDRWDRAGAEQSLALAPVEVFQLPWHSKDSSAE